MPTANGIAFTGAIVYISPDGATWTNASAHGSSVKEDGGDRAVGVQNTFDGVLPIVKAGDRKETNVTIRFVYTPTDTEPFDVARTAHEGEDPEFWVQYLPETSDNWFKTGAGVIKTLRYPQGEAADGKIVMSEFVVACAGLTEAAAST